MPYFLYYFYTGIFKICIKNSNYQYKNGYKSMATLSQTLEINK